MKAATVIVLVALVCATALAVNYNRRGPKAHQLTADYSFEQYQRDFHKSYKSATEYKRREGNFQRALKEVLAHNSQGTRSYKKGINHLSDWDDVELARIRGGRHQPDHQHKYASPYIPTGKATNATSFDWRMHFPPVVTAVKDQGQCGDCWAHSVTEAIESSYAIATGQLFVLSQQQVTACTPQLGSCYSCGGSFPVLAYEYAVENGITEEWIYPFASYTGSDVACNPNPYISTPINTIVNISGYVNVTVNNQDDFISAIQELGPLSILVDASSWSSYESGIFDGCSYPVSLDHAVQVVGYGTEGGKDYWIVRNSWAPSWGEDGYIRLLKTATPQCGWNTGAAYPTDCTGNGPAETRACGECGILFGPTFPKTSAEPPSSSSGSAPSSSGSSPSSSGSAPSSSSGSSPSSSSGSSPSSSSGSAPTAPFVVYGIGQQFPNPPNGYTQASLADIKSAAFVQLYNSNQLTDMNQEMAGCCVFSLTDGYLQYNGQFVVPYAAGGTRQCLEQLSNPVYFGTDEGQWVQKLEPKTLSASTQIQAFCAGTQPNYFAIYKQQ